VVKSGRGLFSSAAVALHLNRKFSGCRPFSCYFAAVTLIVAGCPLPALHFATLFL
jgi:hypothetical protein